MRIIRTALAATAAAGLAVGAAVAVATAQDGDITSFGYDVAPTSVKAGGKVGLTVTECDEEALATSAVFDRTVLRTGGGRQSAQVPVDWDAKPGAAYDVTFICGSETGTTTLTIADGGGNGGRSEVESTSRPPQRQPGKEAVPADPAEPVRPAQPAKPTRPARGGLGGSQDGDTAMLAAGTGLTTAAALGGVVLLWRRRAPGRS